ncbi:hypothetical protein HYH03_000950 [Edaphochlamys debaryana]|uniref:Glutamine amidotransferase type-2 domain-containing protein n=1 Tax=Edaphochlamys debaryana TaxID=47281 RepID=A0A836C6V9_9CHLO|nr:hypothetical protein HYH03_000950 [Edaphochlamys debaryana]|eukprot:KAG2501132.1 hypothetical protein HYH03_000950 [Edaphochlamys debaryana]
MEHGRFFAYAPKHTGFLGSLLGLGSRSGAEGVAERIEGAYRSYVTTSRLPPSQTQSTQPQKFVYAGGGAAVAPGVQAITDHLVRVTPYVSHSKDALIIFNGQLSNLQDLRARRREYGGSGAPVPETAGVGAQTTAMLLDMYKHFHGRELMLLAELQGHFAFVILDMARKTGFAARDPSGTEPMLYKVDDEGGVVYTNCLDQLPTADANRREWRELAPGHFMLGREVVQFALSLQQLEKREKKESLDADALHMLLQAEGQGEGGAMEAVRSLMRNRSK